MVFASISVVAFQWMVTVAVCQRFFADQRCQDLFEFLDVFAAALE